MSRTSATASSSRVTSCTFGSLEVASSEAAYERRSDACKPKSGGEEKGTSSVRGGATEVDYYGAKREVLWYVLPSGLSIALHLAQLNQSLHLPRPFHSKKNMFAHCKGARPDERCPRWRHNRRKNREPSGFSRLSTRVICQPSPSLSAIVWRSRRKRKARKTPRDLLQAGQACSHIRLLPGKRHDRSHSSKSPSRPHRVAPNEAKLCKAKLLGEGLVGVLTRRRGLVLHQREGILPLAALAALTALTALACVPWFASRSLVEARCFVASSELSAFDLAQKKSRGTKPKTNGFQLA